MTMTWRRLLRWGLAAAVAGALAAGTALAVVIWIAWPQLPDVRQLREVELQLPLAVHAKDGELIALFGETRRYPVRIAEVPQQVKDAFIAIEDARFYEHEGVDFAGVARAVWLLATTDRERVPGGSTITQQVARGFFLSNEYSYTRKLKEMLLAYKMEQELEKDEIFELYLNKIFFGNRAYGIAAAAEFYYGKTLDQLSLHEAAMLAGIPKFPSSANPLSNPRRALVRRDYILQRMLELGFITREQHDLAVATPDPARPHEPEVHVEAPYVAEMVRQAMVERFGDDALTSGYRVTTTLRAKDQNAAVKALRDGLLDYDRRHGWRGAEGRVEEIGALGANGFESALRRYPLISGVPAGIVTGIDEGGARLWTPDGEILIPPAAARWTGRPLASLLTIGDVVRAHRDRDGAWQLAQLPRAQATLVSLEHESGAIRALVGGFSFGQNKFNRATQAQRQPGSSFKPFVYAAAFERGYHPGSIVLDAPVVFRDAAGNVWRPQNDKEDFAGPMRLREAMVQSRNLVSVRLLDAIGVQFAVRYIDQFGFGAEALPPNLSMSLGTASLPPLAVARGYTAFVNGGYRVDPWFIERIEDRHGKVVEQAQPALACAGCPGRGSSPATGTGIHAPAPDVIDGFDFGAPPPTAPSSPSTDAPPAEALADETTPPTLAPAAIDPRTAFLVRSLLLDVVRRGTGTAARVLGRGDVGGKTGSTNDHRDAWFSGFGGDLATTVWVGKDDFTPLGRGEYGGRAALPIWIDYMRVALDGVPEASPAPPPGLLTVSLDPETGSIVPAGTPGAITDYIKSEDYDRAMATSNLPRTDASGEETFDVF